METSWSMNWRTTLSELRTRGSMAKPDSLNWIGQGVLEVAKVFRDSKDLMSPRAKNPPVGAYGNVVRVDEHQVYMPEHPRNGELFMAVCFMSYEDAPDDTSAGQEDYYETLKVVIVGENNQGLDGRVALQRVVQQAAVLIPEIVRNQIHGDPGGSF